MIKIFQCNDKIDDFYSNSYIIGNKNEPCIIIDPSRNDDKYINYLKENHPSCLGIIITHGHWDHIRGSEKVLDLYPSTTVFIDENDAECLINPRLNCSYITTSKEKTINIEPYRLEDEDEIRFKNFNFKIIETPFHSRGSICILLEAENALFTGDTLFKGTIGRTDLPHSCKKEQQNSLNKLKKLDPDLKIYPGHGEMTTLKNELENNIYLK